MTEDCNLGCEFCGYSIHRGGERKSADPDEVARIGGLLARYRHEQHREVLVAWLGGEPFAWKPLALVSRLFRFEHGLLLSATTNGVPLRSSQTRKLLLDCFEEIVISVDGIGAFHDQARDRRGLFEELGRDIRQLSDEKIQASSPLKIKANTILMRGNIDRFEELCEHLAGWGVEGLTFNQLGGRDRPEFYPENRLLESQLSAFTRELPRIRRSLAERGFTIYGSDAYLERIASSIANTKVPVADCAPGSWFLCVSESGLVSPCGATTHEYGVPTRELQTVADIEQLQARYRAMRRDRRARACDDCLCTQVFGKFDPPLVREAVSG